MIQGVLERVTRLDAADGGDLGGQCMQGRFDLFDVGGLDALFELEQDWVECSVLGALLQLEEGIALARLQHTDVVNGHGGVQTFKLKFSLRTRKKVAR